MKMKILTTKIKYVMLLIFAIFLILPLITYAVSIEELEQQIQDKQNQITELQRQIDVYQTAVKNKQGEALTLKNQINALKSKIGQLETEIKLTETQISQTNLKINGLEINIAEKEENLHKERDGMREILRTINEYDKETFLEIMLKNQNFSDLLSQMQYAESLQEAIQGKIENIKNIKKDLEQEKNNSEIQKNILESFQNDLEQKQNSLSNQKSEKNYLLTKTKGEESRYQKLLNEIIKEKAAFSKEIQELERQILAAKGYSIRVQATQIPPVGTDIFKRPRGILTQGYGMTEFAKKGAYNEAPHNGVDFSSGAGTPIIAATSGKVLAKGNNKGWGNWIALVHPDYFNLVTLYAHMKNPSDSIIGSLVNNDTIIGYEGSTGFSTGAHLHFSVYSDFFTFLKNGELYFNYFEGTLNPMNYMY